MRNGLYSLPARQGFKTHDGFRLPNRNRAILFNKGLNGGAEVNHSTVLTYDVNKTIPGALYVTVSNTAGWRGFLWPFSGGGDFTISAFLDAGFGNSAFTLCGIIMTDTIAATGGNSACHFFGNHSTYGGFGAWGAENGTNFNNAAPSSTANYGAIAHNARILRYVRTGTNYFAGMARHGGSAYINQSSFTLAWTPTHFGLCFYNNVFIPAEFACHGLYYSPVAYDRPGGQRVMIDKQSNFNR